ncbi:hypothetical protein XTPLMG728_2634 [Xanthomonas translucens pv. poae]|uniref:Uncharacterized protein n=1 Tax=Xanthomonas graminis pv. poae TaxID=227946 RepID=A0A0K3A517_9XANT|nr:hypothetical protein XTPLMG728_2634 [Xanthomonas translucens pv. poae]
MPLTMPLRRPLAACRASSVQAAALRRPGDLRGVADADRVDVVGVDDAGAQERHLPVELQVLQAVVGDAQHAGHRVREQALVGQVVDGQQAWRAPAGPAHVGGGQRARPVVEVQQVRMPVQPGAAAGDLRGGVRQRGEAQRVVFPVAALAGHVRRTLALEQLRAQQHVHAQAIGAVGAAHGAGRQAGMGGDLADDLQRPGLAQHRRVAGDQHADVAAAAQRARQRRGHVAQAAGLDEVGHLRGHEQAGAARRRLQLDGHFGRADEASARIAVAAPRGAQHRMGIALSIGQIGEGWGRHGGSVGEGGTGHGAHEKQLPSRVHAGARRENQKSETKRMELNRHINVTPVK